MNTKRNPPCLRDALYIFTHGLYFDVRLEKRNHAGKEGMKDFIKGIKLCQRFDKWWKCTVHSFVHAGRPLNVTPLAQCPANEERSSSSGVILSPGFPSNYPNSQTCSWLLHMIPGKACVSSEYSHISVISEVTQSTIDCMCVVSASLCKI